MIIPVKCFTCGTVIASKYRYYLREVSRIKTLNGESKETIYLTADNADKTVEGEVMDKIGLKRICCRRHMLTHVDIE
jgi:DNA-directed RNA polymerase I, II, and III subunit RPABC5